MHDPNIPNQFICFECRCRADITWELIRFDIYPQMFSKFKDLALYRRDFITKFSCPIIDDLCRRAIKVAQRKGKFSSSEFSKAFGKLPKFDWVRISKNWHLSRICDQLLGILLWAGKCWRDSKKKVPESSLSLWSGLIHSCRHRITWNHHIGRYRSCYYKSFKKRE